MSVTFIINIELNLSVRLEVFATREGRAGSRFVLVHTHCKTKKTEKMDVKKAQELEFHSHFLLLLLCIRRGSKEAGFFQSLQSLHLYDVVFFL